MNQGSVVPVDETPFKPSSPYYFPVSTSMSAFASQYPDQDHCNIVLYVRNVEMNSTEFIAIAKWAGELKFWGVNTTTKRAFLLYKEYMSALSMFNVLVGYGCLVGLVSVSWELP